jgi:MHS family proline/betaine transporter-like MFS transporter
MFVIAVLPTESSIGILAPIALVLVRLVQGFSLGGEFGGAITILAESAPALRRGWFVNFAQVSAGVGTLLSSGLVVVLHSFLSDGQMQDFGWRIPFLIGGILGVIAIVALLRTPESKMFTDEAEDDREVPLKDLFHTERRPLVLNSLLNGYQSLSYYVIVTFVPTYLVAFEGAPPEEGILAGVIAALVFTLVSPPAGGLSDRLGRKPVLFAAVTVMVVAAVPLFLVLGEAVLPAVIPAQNALMALVTHFSGTALVTGCELFTTRTRYSGVSIGFNVGATVFGGTAPLIATGLIKLTDYNQAPAVLLAVAAALTLVVIAMVPETSPRHAPGGEQP